MSDDINTRDQNINNATRWMAEINFVNNEHFLNTIILNIYKASSSISHVELINDSNQGKMLIFLKLTMWGRWFRQDTIASDILSMMTQALSSYEFRVIFSQEQFNKSLELAKRASMNKAPD